MPDSTSFDPNKTLTNLPVTAGGHQSSQSPADSTGISAPNQGSLQSGIQGADTYAGVNFSPPSYTVPPDIPSFLQEYPPEVLNAMDWVSFAIDALDATSGPGWERPPDPVDVVRQKIKEYRQEAAHFLDRLKNSYNEAIRKNLEAKIQTLTYEANRLEAALNAGRDIPGGMIDVQLNGRTAYFVPDLHGNLAGLGMILNWVDPNDPGGLTLLQKLKANKAVLIIGGDSIHPCTNPLNDMGPSIEMVQDITKLTVLFPDQFFYPAGNHDRVYGAGEEIFSKGGVFQGVEFRDQLISQRRIAYARSLQAFMSRSPLLVRVMNGEDVVAVAGHTPIAKNGLTPAQAIAANFDPDLEHELTWNTPYDAERSPYYPEDLAAMRAKIGSPGTVFLSGHTDNEVSFWQPENMPGHVIGQATEFYNDNLGLVRITANSVEIVHVTGTSPLAGINLRDQLILDLTAYAVADDTPLAAPEIIIPKYGAAQFLNGAGINLGLGFLGFAAVHGYEHLIGRTASGWEKFAGYTIPTLAGIGGQYGLAVKVAQQTGLTLSSAMGSAIKPTISTLPSGLLSGLPIGYAVARAESILGVDPASIEGEIGTIFTTGVLAEFGMAAEVGGTSATGAMAAGATGTAIGTAALSGLAVAGSALGGVLLGTGLDHLAGQLIKLVDKNSDGMLSGAIARDPWLAAPIITWAACANPFIGGGIYLAHKACQWSTDKEKYKSGKAAVSGAIGTITDAAAGAGREVSETVGEAVKFVSDAADSLGDIGREALEGAKL
jgi:hypothetical protein